LGDRKNKERPLEISGGGSCPKARGCGEGQAMDGDMVKERRGEVGGKENKTRTGGRPESHRQPVNCSTGRSGEDFQTDRTKGQGKGNQEGRKP